MGEDEMRYSSESMRAMGELCQALSRVMARLAMEHAQQDDRTLISDGDVFAVLDEAAREVCSHGYDAD